MENSRGGERGKRRRFPVLMLVSALLMAAAVVGALSARADLLQFAFLPQPSAGADSGNSYEDSQSEYTGSGENADSGSLSSIDSAAAPAAPQTRGESDAFSTFVSSSVWAGENIPMTIGGVKSDVSVSREGGSSASDITLQLAGPRYQELYPRAMEEGFFLSEKEIGEGRTSIVLDSEVAFKLFGDVSPLGEKVSLEGTEYTVAGIARAGRSLGSRNKNTVWIPLNADVNLKPDLMILSAIPGNSGEGFATLWKNEAEAAFGAGTYYHLGHERVRSTMLPRILLILTAIGLLGLWIKQIRRWGAAFLADARIRLKKDYAVRLIGYFALRILAFIILTAVTLAAIYLVAVFTAEPLQVFPEWVPEKPVALSSIMERFWSLIADNASPVRLVTEQSAIFGFWTFAVRASSVMLLISIIRELLRWIKSKKAEK